MLFRRLLSTFLTYAIDAVAEPPMPMEIGMGLDGGALGANPFVAH
jgi:hypothetical protein